MDPGNNNDWVGGGISSLIPDGVSVETDKTVKWTMSDVIKTKKINWAINDAAIQTFSASYLVSWDFISRRLIKSGAVKLTEPSLIFQNSAPGQTILTAGGLWVRSDTSGISPVTPANVSNVTVESVGGMFKGYRVVIEPSAIWFESGSGRNTGAVGFSGNDAKQLKALIPTGSYSTFNQTNSTLLMMDNSTGVVRRYEVKDSINWLKYSEINTGDAIFRQDGILWNQIPKVPAWSTLSTTRLERYSLKIHNEHLETTKATLDSTSLAIQSQNESDESITDSLVISQKGFSFEKNGIATTITSTALENAISPFFTKISGDSSDFSIGPDGNPKVDVGNNNIEISYNNLVVTASRDDPPLVVCFSVDVDPGATVRFTQVRDWIPNERSLVTEVSVDDTTLGRMNVYLRINHIGPPGTSTTFKGRFRFVVR